MEQTAFETERCFLDLIRAALNGKRPTALPESIKIEDLTDIATRQQMVPLLFSALNGLPTPPEGEVWRQFRKLFLSDCTRSELQTAAYQKLTRDLCARGVRLMPLKGLVLKELYPQPFLRVMSDLDLLFDGPDPQRVTETMTALGYTAESVGKGHHDVYHLYPVLNVELHRRPLSDRDPNRAAMEGMLDRGRPDPEIPGLFRPRNEDLYIHQIAHAAHHLIFGGMGVRGVADIYVMNRTLGEEWDREEINARLTAAGLDRFERELREIAEAFFGEGERRVPEEVLTFLFGGGVYGQSGHSWRYMTRNGSGSRGGYILKTLFPPISELRGNYPVLDRVPALLPGVWAARWADVLVHRGRQVKKVLLQAGDVDREKLAYTDRILKDFGLDRYEEET